MVTVEQLEEAVGDWIEECQACDSTFTGCAVCEFKSFCERFRTPNNDPPYEWLIERKKGTWKKCSQQSKSKLLTWN